MKSLQQTQADIKKVKELLRVLNIKLVETKEDYCGKYYPDKRTIEVGNFDHLEDKLVTIIHELGHAMTEFATSDQEAECRAWEHGYNIAHLLDMTIDASALVWSFYGLGSYFDPTYKPDSNSSIKKARRHK